MAREIIYPHGTELTPDWRPIATAPHDGVPVRVGWVWGGSLRREADSHWSVAGGVPHWDGVGGYPTHWRPAS